MTLEGQGEAFTFSWIDRSSAEVAKPPSAGISSGAGVAACMCSFCKP